MKGVAVIDRIRQYLQDTRLPPVIPVRQHLPGQTVAAPESALRQSLGRVLTGDLRGRRIAITCGSRGIDQSVLLVRTLVSFLRELGAEPFLVPAMGSHGGATAEGQHDLLRHLGLTEASAGAPILSSMQTCLIGHTPKGLPVRIDRYACQADGIILLNRIKPHTSFRGRYESGLLKMLAIGLGKQAGAEATHRLRYEAMGENLESVGRLALERLPILAGVATLENGYGQIAAIHILRPDQILAQEPVLLEQARQLMPRLCLETIDVLAVREIGKDISGTGMDTNIIGRYHTTAASGGPRVVKLGLMDLSEQSGGNANGMGLADFITKRLADKIDFAATYINTLTSTEPASARMPMVLDNDRQVLQACVRLCGQPELNRVRLAIVRHTKALDRIWLSPAALAEAAVSGCVPLTQDGPMLDLPFDETGSLLLFGP